jgi:hypothetical protein
MPRAGLKDAHGTDYKARALAVRKNESHVCHRTAVILRLLLDKQPPLPSSQEGGTGFNPDPAESNLSLSLLLFSIVKIGLQQFSWTTDTWDIR